MRKKILLMLSAFCFMGATVFGQAIEGGAGVIFVDGDPNDNVSLNTVTVNEGNVAYDRTNQIVYYYNPAGADAVAAIPGPPIIPAVTGTHWIAVDVNSIVDPITNILTPEDELSVSITNGVATITFESDATISYVPATNIFTFTDVDGDAVTADLSELDDEVEAGDPSITVTGDGSSATPYQVVLTGANGATAGTVPVTDGTTGALTWTEVVESISVDNEGKIMIKPTTGPAVPLDLSLVPTVANITELNTAAGNLSAGEEGIVRAAENNTFGLPATSAVGVLFFISN